MSNLPDPDTVIVPDFPPTESQAEALDRLRQNLSNGEHFYVWGSRAAGGVDICGRCERPKSECKGVKGSTPQ